MVCSAPPRYFSAVIYYAFIFCDYIFKMYLKHNGFLFSARVVTDRVSGYSKGFGFVQYATIEEAGKGIEGMDGKVS